MQQMIPNNETRYLEFLGLHQNPFPIAPDDENFFISTRIEQILAEIVHGFAARKGFMVLSGETGLGKTSISRRIMRILEEKGIETSLVFHTSCRSTDLLREINRDFGLPADATRLGDLLNELRTFLLEKNRAGQNCALIVDDAQNLDQKSLELIRMISNHEADQKKLVQILLIGQPELIDKLNQPELRQLKSRIIIWKQTVPLQRHELESYLNFKLNVSGNSGRIRITGPAVKWIHRYTHGNLRRINILMDRCLYAGYLKDATLITPQIIRETRQDLHPKNNNIRSIFPGLSWALAATILIIAAFAYFTASGGRFLLKPNAAPPLSDHPRESGVLVPAGMPQIEKVRQLPALCNLPEPDVRGLSSLRTRVKIPHPPSLISLFLNAYQLSSYENRFRQAVQTNTFGPLAKDIYQQTGYHLIRLQKIPPCIKGQYDLLVCNAAQNQQREYLLFWLPDQKINSFYFGYQGYEILTLQKILKEMSLYHRPLDGIVGKGVMVGIVSFQRQWGLPITGYPDENTLFLLSHLKGAKQHGSGKEEKISG